MSYTETLSYPLIFQNSLTWVLVKKDFFGQDFISDVVNLSESSQELIKTDSTQFAKKDSVSSSCQVSHLVRRKADTF